jgi:hypothetical protein
MLVGKPEEKGPLGRCRHILENNIKVDIRDIGCENIDWIDLPQNREQWLVRVNTIINLRVP